MPLVTEKPVGFSFFPLCSFILLLPLWVGQYGDLEAGGDLGPPITFGDLCECFIV